MTIKAHGNPAPSHSAGNKAWQFKLRRYPHFDGLISIHEANDLVTSPERVAKHTFFPFIQYESRWTRFAKKGQEVRVKTRPIRYAGRRDSAIYSYYRHLSPSATKQSFALVSYRMTSWHIDVLLVLAARGSATFTLPLRHSHPFVTWVIVAPSRWISAASSRASIMGC